MHPQKNADPLRLTVHKTLAVFLLVKERLNPNGLNPLFDQIDLRIQKYKNCLTYVEHGSLILFLLADNKKVMTSNVMGIK